MGRHRSASVFATAIALLLVPSAMASTPPAYGVLDALPDTVYAVNNRPTDEVDQTAVGLVWRRLGLMDGNGKAAKKNASNNDLELGGQKVGEVIVQNDQVIGWRNLNGKREAYDLSGGATFAANVWPRVKAGGVIEIIKHGLTGAGGWTNGGVVHLDKKANDPVGTKGQPYNGFTVEPAQGQNPGPGTGRLEDATAYVIPGRQGDDIKVILTVCFSNLQPRKNQEAPLSSVKQTAAGIPGVTSAKGYDECAQMKAVVGLTGQVPVLGYLIMYDDLIAKKEVVKGQNDGIKEQVEKVNDWMKKLPALESYDKVQALLVALEVPDTIASPVFRYEEDPNPPTEAESIGFIEAAFSSQGPAVADADGGTYTYEDSLTGVNPPRIVIPPGALSGETEVAIHIRAETGATGTSGEIFAASRATEFEAEGLAGPTFVDDLTLVLPFDPDYSLVRVYRLAGSVWIPVSPSSVDYNTGTITIETQTMGVYQAFSDQHPAPPSTSVPILPPLGLVATMIVVALQGAWAIAIRPGPEGARAMRRR